MQFYFGRSDDPKETAAPVFRIKIPRPGMGNTQNSRKSSKKQPSVENHSAAVATVSPTHHPGLTKL
jgi:hypothetical protein